MVKNYSLFLIAFIIFSNAWAQCNPLPIDATNVVCDDSSSLVVAQNTSSKLTIQHGANNIAASWTPTNNLWLDVTMTQPYSGGFVTEVYFGNSVSFASHIYTAEYSISGCPQPITSQVIMNVDGISYETCVNSNETIADITFSNYTNSQIDFYTDSSGTTIANSNLVLNISDTYYVSYGTSCSLIPLQILPTTPLPEVETIQNFCTQATWQAEGFTNNGGDLSDISVCGKNLIWYSDAGGTQIITNPSTIILSDNDTYYVSQTLNGCESGLVAVNMMETTCGCIENQDIEGASTSEVLEGYEFYTVQINNTLTSCDINNTIYTDINNQYAPTTFPINDEISPFSLMTLGNVSPAIPLQKTSPFGCSKYAIKINDYHLDSNGVPKIVAGASDTAGTLVKEFIANEVFSFDFSMLFFDANHQYSERPSIMVRLYDEHNNLVQYKCLVSNQECPFIEISGTINGAYMPWSKESLDTSSYIGKKLRAEITINDCPYNVHWATAFIDNLEISNAMSTNSALGNLVLNPILQAGSYYENCSLFNEMTTGGCVSIDPVISPTYPFQICGTYNLPTGATLQNITLEVKAEDYGYIDVYTSNYTSPSPGTFCIDINQNDITAYGDYSVKVELEYISNCSSTPTFHYLTALNSGFKNCPIAACPTDMVGCSVLGSPTFDLTTKNVEILANIPQANQNNYTLSYYTNQTSAESANANDLINNISTYSPPSLPAQVFARLDYNYNALGVNSISDCYDLVEINLNSSNVLDQIQTQVSDLVYCKNDATTVMPVVDLTEKNSEILNGTNSTDYFLEFYLTLSDANNQINLISSPTQYTLQQMTQDIYVRVAHINGCSMITEFTVRNHEMFSVNAPLQIEVCDDDSNPDGYYQFDLNMINNQILSNYQNLNIAYYNSMSDAQSEMNPLPFLFTNSIAFNQTIYVKLSDSFLSCENILPVNLSLVIPELNSAINPIPVNNETDVLLDAIDSTVELSWESNSNDCILDETFDLMMGTSSTQLNLVQPDISTTNFTVQVNDNVTYYWQVIPKSSLTALNSSTPIWQFQTESLSTENLIFPELKYYTISNTLYLDIENNVIETVSLFNLQGKRVKVLKDNESAQAEINMTNLATGVYLAQIQVNGNIKVIKIIKR